MNTEIKKPAGGDKAKKMQSFKGNKNDDNISQRSHGSNSVHSHRRVNTNNHLPGVKNGATGEKNQTNFKKNRMNKTNEEQSSRSISSRSSKSADSINQRDEKNK